MSAQLLRSSKLSLPMWCGLAPASALRRRSAAQGNAPIVGAPGGPEEFLTRLFGEDTVQNPYASTMQKPPQASSTPASNPRAAREAAWFSALGGAAAPIEKGPGRQGRRLMEGLQRRPLPGAAAPPGKRSS